MGERFEAKERKEIESVTESGTEFELTWTFFFFLDKPKCLKTSNYPRGVPKSFWRGWGMGDGVYFAIPSSLSITFVMNPITPILRNKETSQTEIIKIKRNQSNKPRPFAWRLEHQTNVLLTAPFTSVHTQIFTFYVSPKYYSNFPKWKINWFKQNILAKNKGVREPMEPPPLGTPLYPNIFKF